MDREQFRAVGHELVDTLADLLADVGAHPVAREQDPADIKALLPAGLPQNGADPANLLRETARILIDRSTFTSHPQFFGYINGSVAPIGALADLLASAVNPNVGGWALSPAATEIEKQAVSWIAELLGYPASAGGLFVSGGNMANMIAFLAARVAKSTPDVRAQGLSNAAPRLTAYVSRETHTWVQKAHVGAEGRRPVRSRYGCRPLDRNGRGTEDGYGSFATSHPRRPRQWRPPVYRGCDGRHRKYRRDRPDS
jgi:aromatic-L-amino-acid/L-tryptophan decarboxylase